MLDVSEQARMVPMLPCADIDELAAFWTALGLQVTYRQVRPNPYLALRRNAIELHYYGLEGLDPDQNHSTCSIVVPGTAPLHELFAAGLKSRYGRVPMRGVPRMTRPRQRANNAGLSGLGIVDPAGNRIRVSRQPDDQHQPPVRRRPDGVGLRRGRAFSAGGRERRRGRRLPRRRGPGPENPVQRGGTTFRCAGCQAASAWAFLAELRVRLDDLAGAEEAAREVAKLAHSDVPPEEREAVDRAVKDVADLLTGGR